MQYLILSQSRRPNHKFNKQKHAIHKSHASTAAADSNSSSHPQAMIAEGHARTGCAAGNASGPACAAAFTATSDVPCDNSDTDSTISLWDRSTADSGLQVTGFASLPGRQIQLPLQAAKRQRVVCSRDGSAPAGPEDPDIADALIQVDKLSITSMLENPYDNANIVELLHAAARSALSSIQVYQFQQTLI